MLRARLGVDSGQMSRMLRGLEADGLVTVTPSDADGRVRVARLTGAGPRGAGRPRRAQRRARRLDPRTARSHAAHGARRARCAPSPGCSPRRSSSSREVDPESPDAQRCLRAYVAELNRRAPARGFDPRKGATAEPHEVRPPHGAFVVAYLRGEAIGCGAVKHQPGAVTDIKRMWLAESARGLGLGRRLLEHLERLAPRARVHAGPHRDERRAAGGDRALPVGGLRRGRAVQRRAVRRPLVHQAAGALRGVRSGRRPAGRAGRPRRRATGSLRCAA